MGGGCTAGAMIGGKNCGVLSIWGGLKPCGTGFAIDAPLTWPEGGREGKSRDEQLEQLAQLDGRVGLHQLALPKRWNGDEPKYLRNLICTGDIWEDIRSRGEYPRR